MTALLWLVMLAELIATSVSVVPGCALDSLRVPILVYHNVTPLAPDASPKKREFIISPEQFEWQMSYLRAQGIAVLPLDALIDALQGRGRIEGPAVVVVFDDGWLGQYEHAFPVLRRLGYPATFFIFTNPIGSNVRWMTWEQLRELTAAGMTIASHTRTHPRLNRIEDPVELRREIAGSRELLERKLGVEVKHFAYPFGTYTPAVLAAVQEAGYRSARAFPGGPWNHACDVWTLRAVHVTEDSVRFRRIVQPRVTPDGA
jgi:peptidoglycan/xylan/chitin deacetylase (PgdA/CDA1 family)